MRKTETHQFFRLFSSFKSIYNPHFHAWNSIKIYERHQKTLLWESLFAKYKVGSLSQEG